MQTRCVCTHPSAEQRRPLAAAVVALLDEWEGSGALRGPAVALPAAA